MTNIIKIWNFLFYSVKGSNVLALIIIMVALWQAIEGNLITEVNRRDIFNLNGSFSSSSLKYFDVMLKVFLAFLFIVRGQKFK